MMLWLVQKNLYNENRRGDLIEALSRLDIPFLEVEVSNNTITPEIPSEYFNTPIITNGSIMLSNIARERNWQPGSFLNDNYSYSIWSKYYHDFLLNKDMRTSSLREAFLLSSEEAIFVRPVLDNKSFNGTVFSREEFLLFQKNSLNAVLGSPCADTQILISQPKNIGQEHRHYIVNREIVTSSRYKLAGQPNFKEGCDQRVLDLVQQAIDLWTPAPAFVLDTYIAGDEIGIVEIGGICHAGLYEADIIKLVYNLDNIPLVFSDTNKNNKIKP